MQTKIDSKLTHETPQNAEQIKENSIRYLIVWIKKLSVSLVKNKTGKKVEWVLDKDMNANGDTNVKDLIISLRSGDRLHQNRADAQVYTSDKISMSQCYNGYNSQHASYS